MAGRHAERRPAVRRPGQAASSSMTNSVTARRRHRARATGIRDRLSSALQRSLPGGPVARSLPRILHMGRTELPTAVRHLIAERIESVQQLEILLLLRSAPDKDWSPPEVARALVTQVESSEEWLEEMTRDRLLVTRGRGYRYAPATAELEAAVDGLAESYAKYRVTVIALIFSQPSERVRTFSDAFRIRGSRQRERRRSGR